MSIQTREGLQRLLEGNDRFREGRAQPYQANAYGVEVAAAQKPFAVILGCSDSRVPIETIFDQQPGDVFVIRVAGNIVTDEGLGSMEYAVDQFQSPLVLVLGHSGCGAVAAAISQVVEGTHFTGHIGSLVSDIAPAVGAVREDPDMYNAAIAENVRRNMIAIAERSPLMAQAQREGRITIAGAVYDLHTGRVRLIE